VREIAPYRYHCDVVQIKAPSAESIAVLILSPCEKTRASLLSICAGQYFTVYEARDLRQAVTLFRRYAPPVAICSSDWHDFIEITGAAPQRICVIVTDPFADESPWSEVLNVGGFDVLGQPLDQIEVIRTVEAAFRRSGFPNRHSPVFEVAASDRRSLTVAVP
jgi:DNA-binding response OmpR family regulator